MKDYYRILQVHPDASQEVMNTAYRTLVRQFHPDLYHTTRKSAMNEKMQEINEAYQVLSNPATRADYDRRYRGSVSSPETGLPPLPFKSRLRRIIVWGCLAYGLMTWLVKPFLASPWMKLLAVIVMAVLLFQIYIRQKQPKP